MVQLVKKRTNWGRCRLSLNKIFMLLGAPREEVYRRGTLQGYHGRKPNTYSSTTIYTDTTETDLLYELRQLYLEKAKIAYPRKSGDDGKEMAVINSLYAKGKHIIKNHYAGI